MKRLLSVLIAVTFFSVSFSQTLKPYILGSTFKGEMAEAKSGIKTGLEAEGFKITGEYMPASDASRWVITVSHPALDKAVSKVKGLTGFAAVLRVALTEENGVINITYTDPEYWGNAYFRNDFDKVKSYYKELGAAFQNATGTVGEQKNTAFGSKKGIKISNLRKYHYMFGMPYFDDTEELGDFDSHNEAVAAIDKAFAEGRPGVKMVYKYTVPGTTLTLYGVALTGENGEKNFLPKIDLDSPKHTASLPYEILVKDNEVLMLHGRFRIALSFPDLTMGTFTKIMSTPGDIEDLLQQLVED